MEQTKLIKYLVTILNSEAEKLYLQQHAEEQDYEEQEDHEEQEEQEQVEPTKYI